MSVERTTPALIASLVLVAGFTCSLFAADDAPAAFSPTPNPAQMAWHKAEQRMFIHFGMKTFYPSSNHMGNDKEDPGMFNPKEFSAKQWVEAAKAGGFEGIVFTTKHHDGFCNWSTDTTDHCVRSSPWKDGKGDMVRELIDACRQGGLTFGLYVSIIDRHFEHAGSPKYSSYGDYYLEQIRELSTRYGEIDDYWFDGYKSEKTKIDYQKLSEIIRENQGNAVVYDSGTLVKFLPDRCLSWPGHHGGTKPDQAYSESIEGKLCWYPKEPSTILQGNWFHNGKPIISLRAIQDQYLSTVGYGLTPLMNVSPNKDGLIDAASVVRLKEFKAWVDELHANDLTGADGVKVSALSIRDNSPRYSPERVVDGNDESYYAPADQVTDAVIEIELGEVQEIRGFILKEHIALGQRVKGYRIECRSDGQWQEVFSGSSIGYQRIILAGRASAKDVVFPASDGVRLIIREAKAPPLISCFQVIGSNK